VHRRSGRNESSPGFTLVEMLVVVVILAIIGAVVIPLAIGTGGMEAMSAARIIAADLQYAQNVAMTRQSPVTVQFDTPGDSYSLSNASGPLKHPMTQADYVVDFQSKREFGQLDIVTVYFEGSQIVVFDELGSPDRGGYVTVQGGPEVYRIDIAPVTGTVTVAAGS